MEFWLIVQMSNCLYNRAGKYTDLHLLFNIDNISMLRMLVVWEAGRGKSFRDFFYFYSKKMMLRMLSCGYLHSKKLHVSLKSLNSCYTVVCCCISYFDLVHLVRWLLYSDIGNYRSAGMNDRWVWLKLHGNVEIAW